MSIYECNIDGQSKYQILTTLHNMLMYSTICGTTDNSDRQIADHHITPIQIIKVLNSVNIDPNTTQHKENTVHTLITTILYYFVGDTTLMDTRINNDFKMSSFNSFYMVQRYISISFIPKRWFRRLLERMIFS